MKMDIGEFKLEYADASKYYIGLFIDVVRNMSLSDEVKAEEPLALYLDDYDFIYPLADLYDLDFQVGDIEIELEKYIRLNHVLILRDNIGLIGYVILFNKENDVLKPFNIYHEYISSFYENIRYINVIELKNLKVIYNLY